MDMALHSCRINALYTIYGKILVVCIGFTRLLFCIDYLYL